MEPGSGPFSAARYFEMAQCGIIAPDDNVELLEGLIVAMAPQSPPHSAATTRVHYALMRKLGLDVLVRIQSPFLAGARSVPEPDIAVVPGLAADYERRHPSRAHLIVEVAESSVIQDRITKAAIYARAGVPCYWVVNVRNGWVEVFGNVDRWRARYQDVRNVKGAQTLTIDAFPGVTFEAGELLAPLPGGESS